MMYLDILFQDEHYVAIHKPAGLLVHRTAMDRGETQFAVQLLRDQLGRRVYPVHRLDKPTSGVLLFAFEPESVEAMVSALNAETAHKIYRAVVRGITEEAGVIDYALRREHDKFDQRQTTALQDAVTHYSRLQQIELPYAVGRYATARYSLVELELKTGRKHQIRRHMAHIRHPVIGDSRHGDGAHNRFFREQFNIQRLMLVAVKLEFVHPVTSAVQRIEAKSEVSFSDAVATIFNPHYSLDEDEMS